MPAMVSLLALVAIGAGCDRLLAASSEKTAPAYRFNIYPPLRLDLPFVG